MLPWLWASTHPPDPVSQIFVESFDGRLTATCTWTGSPFSLENIGELLVEAEELGWVTKAASADELAEKAGLPELAATLTEYNEMAAAGEDTIFYKKPEMLRPIETDGDLYLIAYNPGAFNTFGGCRTDKFCRALRADFSVVEGLYIAGVENGSLYSRPYYEVGGSCSGLALSSGRLAGQQMAAEVLGA